MKRGMSTAGAWCPGDGAGHGPAFERREGVGAQVRTRRRDAKDRGAAQGRECGHRVRHDLGDAGGLDGEVRRLRCGLMWLLQTNPLARQNS
jgi:hypothetical protein